MSMISSLIDELNKSADEWNGSNMFELARMCREAVDTITELRGALQVASVDYRHLQDENAKLRHDLEDANNQAEEVCIENARLRELVRDMWEDVCNAPCCAYCDHSDYDGDKCELRDRMRELGGGRMKEYRVCCREHGSEHTSAVKFRDWGGRQNWQGNATDEEREQAALEWLAEHRRFSRIFYGIKECDMWLEVREVSAWQEACADGGMIAENYIRPAEEGPICPVPRASVIFEGQKLTFDEEDSAKFVELVKQHFRKLAGLEDE